MSLVGALSPLGKVAKGKKRWLTDVMVYTLAGSLSSALVGSAIGWLGSLFLPEWVGKNRIYLAVAISAIAIARDLGVLSFPLPQLRRQTKDIWGKIFPRTLAAALWGFDLGLIFTTWLSYSGVWLLTILAFLVGEPAFGTILFILYWLGRALSVWVAPSLMPDANHTSLLMEEIARQQRLFKRTHISGLLWVVVVLLSWWTAGGL